MKWPERINGAEDAERVGHYWLDNDSYGRRMIYIVVSAKPAGADDRGIELDVQAFSLEYALGYLKRALIAGVAWTVIYFGWQYWG